ncbi:hypothetical protein AX16_005245 [Volvariella volvacea WC 439]|nr:hypothetical protein AX16_005245 [Volvariella volvacea WC 439]
MNEPVQPGGDAVCTSNSIVDVHPAEACQPQVYRLYKRRFAGLLGMGLLNAIAAMSWPWFGPIANNVAHDLGYTLDQVNWLGIVVACVYLPTALFIPTIVSRYGIRRCCDIGSLSLLLSAWVRYSGTAPGLSSASSYALILMGQIIAAVAQPIYQVLGPKYSETWFDLNGRITATMVIAISNPIGGAIGQIISPLAGSTQKSILILGILSTASLPLVLLIGRAPPQPPTHAGSRVSPPLRDLVRALLGLPVPQNCYMTPQERKDFAIVIFIFGVMVAATNTFAVLSAQYLEPSGYSDDLSGFMGACLLLTGIIASVITAPLFDRVFTRHLAVTAKVLVPILGCTWLSLIWAVRPDNTAALFVIMTILGACSITMLPVALELACELTRNADGSSAILWFSGNLFGIIFIIVEGALRAGPDADPPLNMHRALIFNGVFVLISSLLVFFVTGKQVRRELDEQMKQQAQTFEIKDLTPM